MIKTTIRNLGVTLKPRLKTPDQQVVYKMKKLPQILSAIVDTRNTKNNLHVIKWVDSNGFINVAFQIVGTHQFGNDNSLSNCSSLVFSQNDADKISITLFHIAANGLKSPNDHKVIGTYSYDELTETFILKKTKQFLDFAAVA